MIILKEPGLYIDDKLIKTWEQLMSEGFPVINDNTSHYSTLIVSDKIKSFSYVDTPHIDCDEIYIPNLSIKPYAFSQSTFRKVSSFNNDVIPFCGFLDCKNLEEFDFSKVSIINQSAFNGCDFKSLDLSRVKSILLDAFCENDNLTDVVLEDIEYLGNFTDNPNVNIFYKRTREHFDKFVEADENIYNRIICSDDTIDKLIEKHSFVKSNEIFRKQQYYCQSQR